MIVEKKVDNYIFKDYQTPEKTKMYEDDIKNLKKIINDQNLKINMNLNKDKEIYNLKLKNNELQQEYSNLNKNYEVVLGDLQLNVNNNEKLRHIINNLENKVDNHNNNVGGMDIAIKQQIEGLTRNSLAKKYIDYNSSKDIIDKAKNDNTLFNNNVDKYNLQKLSASHVISKFGDFDNVIITNSNNSVVGNLKNDKKNINNDSYVEILGEQNAKNKASLNKNN